MKLSFTTKKIALTLAIACIALVSIAPHLAHASLSPEAKTFIVSKSAEMETLNTNITNDSQFIEYALNNMQTALTLLNNKMGQATTVAEKKDIKIQIGYLQDYITQTKKDASKANTALINFNEGYTELKKDVANDEYVSCYNDNGTDYY